MYISSGNALEDALENDTGWIAQFYLRPNTLFWPAPTALGMVGPLPLKLSAPRSIRGAALPTRLYPDPAGSLALVTVTSVKDDRRSAADAYEDAYNVVGPVLDELSATYDLPLPVAHSLVVGIPSGLTNTSFPKIPMIRTLDGGEDIPPARPYPELRDAVALYREGVSSNNPLHSFLTLWKVYENACQVRGAWRNRHRLRAVQVRPEVIPDYFAFDGFQDLNFDQARQRLKEQYRVPLAHGDDRGVKPRTWASAQDVMDVSYKVPLVRYMANVVLENVRATLASAQGVEPSLET